VDNILWLQIATYAFSVLFLVLLIARMLSYSRISTHLRWELYPLVGEKDRPWGGSYLEKPEWWTTPHQGKSLLAELRFMGQEVLFFKEYFHLNRDYWYFVYPFHIGVFLFLVFLVLLFVGALTVLGGVSVSAESVNTWGKFLYYATLVTGGTGLVLGAIGCVCLLIKRRINENLKPYTRRTDYFNLLFVLAVFLFQMLTERVEIRDAERIYAVSVKG